jgi:hypothetical protein
MYGSMIDLEAAIASQVQAHPVTANYLLLNSLLGDPDSYWIIYDLCLENNWAYGEYYIRTDIVGLQSSAGDDEGWSSCDDEFCAYLYGSKYRSCSGLYAFSRSLIRFSSSYI